MRARTAGDSGRVNATLFALVVSTLASHAGAQAASDAQRLFDEGRLLLEDKRYAEACDKLSASNALEPSVGTHGLLAACHEKLGKLATAQREYAETAELARKSSDTRETFARDRAHALEPRVPHLTVQLGEGVPANASMFVDGATQATVGRDLALDPGEHVVEIRSADGRVWRARVTLPERERTTVIVGSGRSEISRTAVPAGPVRASSDGSSAASHGPSAARTAGLVALAVGAVGAVGAAVTGAMVLAKKGKLDDACPQTDGGDRACTPAGSALRDELAPLLVVNAIAWGVAIAGVGLGATLVVTGEPSKRSGSATVRVAF